MHSIKFQIKQDLRDCGRTMAELSRASMIKYNRLSGFLNGYWDIRPEEETCIRTIIEDWKIKI